MINVFLRGFTAVGFVIVALATACSDEAAPESEKTAKGNPPGDMVPKRGCALAIGEPVTVNESKCAPQVSLRAICGDAICGWKAKLPCEADGGSSDGGVYVPSCERFCAQAASQALVPIDAENAQCHWEKPGVSAVCGFCDY